MKKQGTRKSDSLEALWYEAPPARATFSDHLLTDLPVAAKLYLKHAVALGTPLASAVRLRMHGEIMLKRWRPFEAVEVIRWDRGMIWQATVRLHGLPIRGFDRLINGEGAMRWRLFGLIPFLSASGEDITRSARGRLAAESIWLPSVLCGDTLSWSMDAPSQLCTLLPVLGTSVPLELTVDDSGRLASVSVQRWGNPEGGAHCLTDFGAVVEAEETFSGYTIPTRLRVGWHFRNDRFHSNGEFFRVRIEEASYR